MRVIMGPGLIPYQPFFGRRITDRSISDEGLSLPALLLAETLLMVGVFKTALKLVAQQSFLMASAILVGGTMFSCAALFLMWNRHSKETQRKLACDRAEADARRAEAEAVVLEKSRVLATMSHEIRTPLNGVIGMLGLLLETELSGEQKNYAAMANSSARSLLSILDELLDKAKSEALQKSRSGPMDLEVLVETVTELMAPRAHGKGLEISSYIAPDVPRHVALNDLHLRQILFNLIGNAIKFTQTGGIEINVYLNAGSCLCIDVRDSGIGMDELELQRVFGEFSQANDQTERRFGGTGLGLHISRKLAQSMGAALDVSSTPKNGTTFHLAFAKPLANHQMADAVALKGRSYALALADGSSADLLQKALVDLGAEVTVWEPGKTTSAIICDCDSAEAIQQQFQRAKHVPQIWVLLKPEERRAAQHLLTAPLTTGYLLKPVRRSALTTLLTARDDHMLETASRSLRKLAKNAVPKSRKVKPLHILLVEDTDVNALLASTLLAKAGHSSQRVNNGREALALLEKHRNFDVILMDMEMPVMNGREAVVAWRSVETANKWSPIPILALTANAGPEEENRCLALGMNGHLAKPFERQDLEEALARVMVPARIAAA
jgi:signal transduction histidine kinase/CheY-like chemotaxis protein